MAYYYFIWKFHRSLLIFSAVVISAFQFLFLKLVSAIDYSALLEQLPENMQAMLGGDFISTHTVSMQRRLPYRDHWHPFLFHQTTDRKWRRERQAI
jgi:hypothetical protein